LKLIPLLVLLSRGASVDISYYRTGYMLLLQRNYCLSLNEMIAIMQVLKKRKELLSWLTESHNCS
jgi:hypothetical protein